MPEPGGGPGGQYLADQLTLFQPWKADSVHPLLEAPPMFFTFRHHCTFTACPIDIVPSILWPGRGKCNIVGTIIIGHPVLIEEGCRELWNFLDTKDN